MERLLRLTDNDERVRWRKESIRHGLLSILANAPQRFEGLNHYQAKVGAASGEVHSFEALGRLKDMLTPEGEEDIVSPAEFLPQLQKIAEGSRLWTEVAIRNALEDGALLQRVHGENDPGVHISVNVEPQDLTSTMARAVESMLKAHKGGTTLGIEIVETSDLPSTNQKHSAIDRMVAAGIDGISLDDVGAPKGAFSEMSTALRILRDYPQITDVKLDRVMLGDLPKLERAMMTFLETGKRVVIEGVENADQWVAINEIIDRRCPTLTGNVLLQGFAFHRPEDAENALITIAGKSLSRRLFDEKDLVTSSRA